MYEQYLRLDDRAPRVSYKLALARYRANNIGGALTALDQTLRLDDRMADAHYLRALCLRSQQLLSASVDGTVKLWQVPVATPAPRVLAHTDAVNSAVISPDGASLLTGGNDKQVRIWNLANGQPRVVATLPAAVLGVAYSDNGASVAAGSNRCTKL